MKFLYLDESGDLGFNFEKNKSTRFFLVTILLVNSYNDNKKIISAIKKTLKRKVKPKKQNSKIYELKGSLSKLEIKQYFYNQVKDIDFNIFYSAFDKMIFDPEIKREKSGNNLKFNKHELYNKVAFNAIKQINKNIFINDELQVIIDKSKNKNQIKIFDRIISENLVLKNTFPTSIHHIISQNDFGLQACDLFSYGILEKYEFLEKTWFGVFSNKII